MNKKIFILSILFLPLVIILTGCQSSTNKDDFLKNNECVNHREMINKEIDKYNKENKASKETSFFTMGDFGYFEKSRKFLDVFYSIKTNSCLYVVSQINKYKYFDVDGIPEPGERSIKEINEINKGEADTSKWKTDYEICIISVSSGQDIECFDKNSEYTTNTELEKILIKYKDK